MLGEGRNGGTPYRLVRGDGLDKYIMPPYLLQDNYPSYLNGPGYLLPRWSIPCLSNAMWKTPVLPIEDIYHTGFLAVKCGVKRFMMPNFNGQKSQLVFERDLKKVKASEKIFSTIWDPPISVTVLKKICMMSLLKSMA